MMDEHVIEGLGKARIVVRDGKVAEVGEPLITYCPIFDKHRGIKKIDRDAIAKNIQFRIDDFGMCTPDRVLTMKDFLSFGVSEIVCTAMRQKRVDAAVLVCEGCGTVIVTDPDMVQGIGGRVSGLVSTTPIPRLIERIGPGNILDPKTARIDQVAGIRKAIGMGFKNIAVSIVDGSTARLAKEIEKEHPGVNVYTLVVHVTGMSEKEAGLVFQYADIATGCASKYIWKEGASKAICKVGDSVPIFGITPRGKELIEERIKFMGKPVVPKPDAKIPEPLI
jgi:putative methanogenesis marker protein 8